MRPQNARAIAGGTKFESRQDFTNIVNEIAELSKSILAGNSKPTRVSVGLIICLRVWKRR